MIFFTTPAPKLYKFILFFLSKELKKANLHGNENNKHICICGLVRSFTCRITEMADFLDLMKNNDKLILYKDLETYYRQNMFWQKNVKILCVKYF